tara:strand:+ start:340 stop:1347 length:1008 start_codon:yes stop_codon:yes gene_type:complete
MSKKINMYIHPGYGKTGTTYLQESIFDKINFVNLGKPHNHKNELINKLILLQYKIFQPKFLFQKLYPMNYSYSVRNYVSILKTIIDKADNTNFMFSDECLFNHNNYFGYFNVYLLKEILDSLNNYFDINIKFIISIRNQHEYLRSCYAYDNYRMKKNFGSFNNFLDKIFSDEDLSEIYQYDLQIKKIKKIFNSEVLVLPLEELEKNPKNYINRVINFLGIEKEVELNTFNNDPINKNSELENKDKIYYIRSYDFRIDLFEYFSNIHLSLKKYKLYQKNFKYLRFLKELIKPNIKKTGKILSNENQKRKIQQHFKQSNQNTEKNTNLNLKFYDYYD